MTRRRGKIQLGPWRWGRLSPRIGINQSRCSECGYGNQTLAEQPLPTHCEMCGSKLWRDWTTARPKDFTPPNKREGDDDE